MFNKIYNDKFVKEAYIKADDPNSKDVFWVYHGMKHIDNVIDLVEKILIEFDYDKEYIENAKIAALFHDIGYEGIKKDHEIRSYNIAKKYFKDNNIELKFEDEVLEAIISHRGKFDTNNVMAIVLILADKLDIKKTRLTNDALKIEGIREWQYIDDIIVNKTNDLFTVKFIIDDKANKKELEEWYFIAKVFRAIKSFSNHFNLKYKIFWNDKDWTIKND